MFHARSRSTRLAALLLPLALIAGGCGGKDDKKSGSSEDVTEADAVRGGTVTYGIEAETGDGWCLQEAQLAISGILVARTIYDTLTVPNDKGEYVPYLAESVENSDDYKTWTITLREGVKFHNGEDLTAEVVKNNLDAYRGFVGPTDVPDDEKVRYEGRSPLLFLFVLENINDVQATGDLEVTVTTKVPWVAFPSFLYSSGRLGMTAQAQLDDQETCDSKLIGTGPFKLKEWEKDRELIAEANPDYWQEAPDGKPYPYLEEIRFTPIIESEQRVNSLESGDIDLAHISAGSDFKTLNAMEEDGKVIYFDSNKNAEVAFLQMNSSNPPFDDARVRKAMALAVDRADYKEVINRGLFTNANGPFAKGSIGYLADTGFPVDQDLDEAKQLVGEYESENGEIPAISYQATPGTITQQAAVYVQQVAKTIGVEVNIDVVQQDTLIDNAISGAYEIMGFRNYPGGDPDELYVWFKGGSPVNFGRITDDEIDELLDEGRSEPDPKKREKIYQDVNREFGKDVWSIWTNWTTWRIASQPTLHGYDPATSPKLPGEGDSFDNGLATGHPLHGLWVESSN